MQKKEMVCIGCPMGCTLTAVRGEDGEIQITGNNCNIGDQYARKELTDPRRIVTSTVRIAGESDRMLPVKTATDIPKGKIKACMEAVKQAEAVPPIHIGDVIVENVADTGVDIVATKAIDGPKK